MPELSWLNDNDRHRAQGFVSLETINKQHGYLQVKLDVSDKNGVLSDGIFICKRIILICSHGLAAGYG
ncbi:hypothetical protein J4727_05260 [Providencia rettgeri]|uniref:Uncharacterized protein n=1 Tax=Providencia rettgeri TaxID=587 RepID=A0A939NF42_PRORE|nr:hypothetical protein [Providencia rettgeri]